MPTTYAIPDGRTVMAATTYTGNGSSTVVTNTVNGVSFQPDFVWVKNRSTAGTDHVLSDSVRGGNGTTLYRLFSDLTNAESANNSNAIATLNSNGFTVAGVSPYIDVNANGSSYIGWNWKAGGTAVSNTAGSITSSVSANTTAGFSVVTYTGTGSSATVGHGLGVAPNMIICKARGQAENWAVYHSSLSNAVNVAMFLNLTNAVSGASNAYWNSTAPSSTVFSVNTATTTNAANTMVAYCFAAVAGYSAFGSYTGNGSTDGPFVYLGFRPRYVMIKRTDAVNNWVIYDTARDTFNKTSKYLYAQSSQAEVDDTVDYIDILSNGFKPRATWGGLNASGGTYIYMAFAENPFKYANAR
jgi:hypothetical protein